MTAIVPAEPASLAELPSSRRRLSIDVVAGHVGFVVHVTGELDLATRSQLVSASTVGKHPNTTIDLSGLTFMDCSGYRALVAARRFIESEGRRLTITGQIGQPARFLDMIAELEERPLRPDLNHRPASAGHPSPGRRNDSVAVQVAVHSN